MNAHEIERMEKFEKTYWWHVGKKHLVKYLVEKYTKAANLNILEIGCGAGEITQDLQKYGTVLGNDVSETALAACRSKGFQNLLYGDINQLDLSSYTKKFDLILALDVLEHIQNDMEAMQRIIKLLKPGGIFLVAVPAYKFLWSSHDEALEHKRRYTSFEIITKLKDTGFSILKNSHFVFWSFFPIALVKFLGNFLGRNAYPKSSYIELPDFLNNFMIKVLEFETRMIDKLYLPLGTTIVVVAKKN